MPAVATGETATLGQSLQQRVLLELRARGWSAVALDGALGSSVDALATLRARVTTEHAALGLMIVATHHDTLIVDLHLLDRITGKSLVRSLRGLAAADLASTVALAAAELIDASLLELQTGHVSMRGEVRRPGKLPTLRRRVWTLRGGLGVLWPIRQRTVAGTAMLGASWSPVPHFAVGPELVVPLSPFVTSFRAATVRTTAFMVGARASIGLLPERFAVAWSIDASLLATALRVAITPAPGFVAQPRTTWLLTSALGTALYGRIRAGFVGVDVRVVVPVDAPRYTARLGEGDDAPRVGLQDFRGVWWVGTLGGGVTW